MTIAEHLDRSDFTARRVCISVVILRSVKVTSSEIPNLNATITTAAIDHLTLVRVLRSRDGNFYSSRTFSLHQGLVSELLFNSNFLGIHIPLADCAILGASDKQIVLFGVPLTVIYASNVTLRVGHIKQIHVSSDSSLLAHSFTVIDFCLVVTTAAKEMRATRVERQSPHWVTIKWLEVLEWFQVTVHSCEIPDFHPIVKATRDHFGSITTDAKGLD